MVADPVDGCGSAGAAIVGVVLAVVADPVDGLGSCAAGGAGGGVVDGIMGLLGGCKGCAGCAIGAGCAVGPLCCGVSINVGCIGCAIGGRCAGCVGCAAVVVGLVVPPMPTASCAFCPSGAGCGVVGCVVCPDCAGCAVGCAFCPGSAGCAVGCAFCPGSAGCPGSVLVLVAGSCVPVSGWSDTSSVAVPGTTGGWASFIMSMYFLKNLGSMVCSDSVI